MTKLVAYKPVCTALLLCLTMLTPAISQPVAVRQFPEQIRAGYNYNASLDFYYIAKDCGLNTIISRLDIANEYGHLEMKDEYGRIDHARESYDLIQPSARLAEELDLSLFLMINPAAFEYNYREGLHDNDRRYNNGRIPAPTDSIYWTRVIENRFLEMAELCAGPQYKIDGFLLDPEMYILDSAKPSLPDYGDFAIAQFLTEVKLYFDFKSRSINDRKQWLKEQNLLDDYQAFQVQKVKKMAERTRQKLQVLHPEAILGFFMWRNNSWFKAVAAGFAATESPCFIGPELTYDGGYSVLFTKYRDLVKKQAGVPLLFVPGIDLSLRRIKKKGAILKGNLYYRTLESDGYFIWSLARCFENLPRKPVAGFLTEVNAELKQYLESGGEHNSSFRSRSFPVSELRALLALQR